MVKVIEQMGNAMSYISSRGLYLPEMVEALALAGC